MYHEGVCGSVGYEGLCGFKHHTQDSKRSHSQDQVYFSLKESSRRNIFLSQRSPNSKSLPCVLFKWLFLIFFPRGSQLIFLLENQEMRRGMGAASGLRLHQHQLPGEGAPSGFCRVHFLHGFFRALCAVFWSLYMNVTLNTSKCFSRQQSFNIFSLPQGKKSNCLM